MQQPKQKKYQLTYRKHTQKSPCLHCQSLNEIWEGEDPGSTLSSHSGALHAPELLWIGLAFLPGDQSLFQTMTYHFYYTSHIFKTEISHNPRSEISLCHLQASGPSFSVQHLAVAPLNHIT